MPTADWDGRVPRLVGSVIIHDDNVWVYDIPDGTTFMVTMTAALQFANSIGMMTVREAADILASVQYNEYLERFTAQVADEIPPTAGYWVT